MNSTEFDVLLIYNMKDGAKAKILASNLNELGLSVWFDQWQIVPGTLWAEEIENAVSHTRVICICIGPSGLGESSKNELRRIISIKGSNEENLMVPILLPGGSPKDIPSELANIQFSDLRSDITNSESLRFLVELIQKPKIKVQHPYLDQRCQAEALGNISGNKIDTTTMKRGPDSLESSANSIMQNIPHQIPPPPPNFKGRDEELRDAITNFDRGATIIGLQGIGGIGKTALALMLADKLKDCFPDGQFLIDLLGTSNKPLPPAEAMAHVIHSYFPSILLPNELSELRGLFLSVLAGRRALILLENAACLEQVEPMLPPVGCTLIITSRRKIILPGMNVLDLDILTPSDARDLLLAVNARIGYNADDLAKLCGYLPLALCNAAGVLAERIDIDVAEYIRRLKDARERLDLVEASFSLSYDLLAPELQRLWCTLSVFPADFDREGAAAVWKMELDAVDNVLSKLVEWSLVNFIPSTTHKNLVMERYRLHDLARLFAGSHLDSAIRDEAQLKHAEYYMNILSVANSYYLQGGKNIAQGLDLFDRESANILAGQMWANGVVIRLSEPTNNPEMDSKREFILRLSSTYPNSGRDVLDLRIHPRERIGWLETSLIAARIVQDRKEEGNALRNLGKAYADLSDVHKAIILYEQALEIDREIENKNGEETTLRNLGNAYSYLSETRKAIEFYEMALDIDQAIGDRRGEGSALGSLGVSYRNLGEIRKAIEFYGMALAIDQEIGDRRGESNALNNLGVAHAILKESRKAIEFFEKSLAIDQEIGDRRGEAAVLTNLGNAFMALGDAPKAIEFFEKSLAIDQEIGGRRGEGFVLTSLGTAFMVLGETRKAIEFYEQALAIACKIGDQYLEADTLANMSLAQDVIGSRAKAIDYAKNAIRIYERIESPRIKQMQQRLAEWQLAVGNLDTHDIHT